MDNRPASPRLSVGRLIAGLITAVCCTVALGTAASAGGWAVTTLDEVPTPVPGEEVDVGFTIRQHGVTPVALDEGVAIEVVAEDGTSRTFPAAPEGALGHYVASVVFPDAGEYGWSVHQGWFAEQDLGSLVVATAPPPGTEYRFPAAVRFGLPALAAACAVFAIVDVSNGRRRRRTSMA